MLLILSCYLTPGQLIQNNFQVRKEYQHLWWSNLSKIRRMIQWLKKNSKEQRIIEDEYSKQTCLAG